MQTPTPADAWAINATHATPVGTLARCPIRHVDFIDRVATLLMPGADGILILEFSLDEIAEA